MIDPEHKWPVQRQCASLGLSRSAFYCRPRGPSPEHLRMLAAAVALHREQPSMGARRLALQLRPMGFKCDRRMARRLMIEAQLHSVSPGPHSSTRPRRDATPAPNLLKQAQPCAPNRVWASDLTQLQIGKGLMHAAVIIDPNTRYIVGASLSNTADTDLCLNVLEQAIHDHGCPAIFHSDKGAQYTSRRFKSVLRQLGIKQSMTGDKGWKNDIFMERFIWTLKNECSKIYEWTTGAEARRGIADFIHYYNYVRGHSRLDGRTSAEVHGVSDEISGEPLDPSGC